jgi:hypothetical protein
LSSQDLIGQDSDMAFTILEETVKFRHRSGNRGNMSVDYEAVRKRCNQNNAKNQLTVKQSHRWVGCEKRRWNARLDVKGDARNVVGK